MITIFVYGSLLESRIRDSLLGRPSPLTDDGVLGYRLETVLDTDGIRYPNAIPQKESGISGGILEVNEEELKRVDEYEGERYERIAVTTQSGRRAYMYISN